MARGPRRSRHRRLRGRRTTISEAGPLSLEASIPEDAPLSPNAAIPEKRCNNVLEMGNGKLVTVNFSTRSSTMPTLAPFLASSSSISFLFYPIPSVTTLRIYSSIGNQALSQEIATLMGVSNSAK